MTMKFSDIAVSALGLCLGLLPVTAQEFSTAAVFSSHMVLQQQSEVAVWGSGRPGSKVVAETTWSREKVSCKVGEDGRWRLSLQTPEGSYDQHTVTLSDRKKTIVLDDVKIGEVWLCSGQSNMEMIMKPDSVWRLHVENAAGEIASADFPEIRYLNVFRSETYQPQEDIHTDGWHRCSPESVIWLSAAGYYFAREIQEELDVPVGLLVDSYGGSPIQSWLPAEVAEDPFYAAERARLEKHISSGAGKPEYDMVSSLFNGMLSPVAGFGIRGFLWYQGCSNVSDAARYPRMMTDLVSSWRRLWGKDLPFYHVQIAPFVYPAYQQGRWAELAYSQMAVTERLGNSGLVVTADIGDPDNIHPGKKRPVGERLAALALNMTYGRPVACLSPEALSAVSEGNRTVVVFGNSGEGLHASSSENEFEVSADGITFTRPEYNVSGDRVELESVVGDIRYVRYCWRDNARSNIFNSDGLPLGPFVMEVR